MAIDEDIRRARQARELAAELAKQRAAASQATMYMGESARESFPGASVPSTFNAGIGGAVTATLPGTLQPTLQPTLKPTLPPATKTIISTYTDPTTGDVIAVYSDNTTAILSKGTRALDAAAAAQAAANAKLATRQSAYDLLFEQFNKYGLGSLVEGIKNLITSDVPPSEFSIRLRETDAYKKRFAANAQRISRGLRAIDEATYIGLEDAYQEIMRNYGLPQSYYARGDMGRQEGFEKFIAADVSAPELEDRIQTAYNRVINANPEVSQALRQFYPDITNGDILAYALDPDQALTQIKRKVTAAEIGGAAMAQGLATGLARAEELQRYGVTGAQAREGFQTVAAVTPRAGVLADIYAKQGLGPYTQATAEQEVFGLPSAAEATRRRQKLTELETAQFAGSSGMAGGALARERAGSF